MQLHLAPLTQIVEGVMRLPKVGEHRSLLTTCTSPQFKVGPITPPINRMV